MINAKELGGVQLFYERRSSEDVWGDLADDEVTSFKMTPALKGKLEDCFSDMWTHLKTPLPEGIISAGAYVNKPGEHGKGKAFDLDGIVWESGFKWDARTLGIEGSSDRKRYLAIQAQLLQYFGVVLGYQYNKAHYDHLHVDMSREVGFIDSYSIVAFAQDALNSFWSTKLRMDGSWGPKTKSAMEPATKVVFSGKYPEPSTWDRFLVKVVDKGAEFFPRHKVKQSDQAKEGWRKTHGQRLSDLEVRVTALEQDQEARDD